MGITDPLPHRVLRLVSKADRKSLGPAGETYDEAQDRSNLRLEREMHADFEQWLRLNQYEYLHAATNRKSTIQVGWPDFTILRGTHVCLVEMKTESGRLSEDQKTVIAKLLENGTPVCIAKTVADAIEFVRRTL